MPRRRRAQSEEVGDLFGGAETWKTRREALHGQYKKVRGNRATRFRIPTLFPVPCFFIPPFHWPQRERLDDLRGTVMGILEELEHEGPREEKGVSKEKQGYAGELLGYARTIKRTSSDKQGQTVPLRIKQGQELLIFIVQWFSIWPCVFLFCCGNFFQFGCPTEAMKNVKKRNLFCAQSMISLSHWLSLTKKMAKICPKKKIWSKLKITARIKLYYGNLKLYFPQFVPSWSFLSLLPLLLPFVIPACPHLSLLLCDLFQVASLVHSLFIVK